jgi:hypothetical protein
MSVATALLAERQFRKPENRSLGRFFKGRRTEELPAAFSTGRWLLCELDCRESNHWANLLIRVCVVQPHAIGRT